MSEYSGLIQRLRTRAEIGKPDDRLSELLIEAADVIDNLENELEAARWDAAGWDQ